MNVAATPDSPEALARVLVLMMLTDCEVDEREIEMLDRLDAFNRLGLSRQQFMRVARDHCAALQQRMGQAASLRHNDPALVDELLANVRDPAKRLLVCRLAAALLTADGKVHDIERVTYDHMLGRWGLTRADVQSAIRRDPVH
jgi:uncharacterized protein YjiS (DUF1127 family)